jgi:hypothetical protein
MKIAKTASLPLEVIRGTVKERHEKMHKIVEKIFYNIVEKPEDLSIARIQQITQDTLTKIAGDGRKINITIKDHEIVGACEGLECYIEKDGVIEGFEIFVPTENGAIKPNYFSVFIHELTHAIHQLTNPKNLALKDSANITKIEKQRAENFYKKTLYTGELFNYFKPISTKIKQSIALRGISDRDKIKILQEFRECLDSEFYAYWEQERFNSRAYKFGIKEPFTTDYDCVMFDEKIEYLEREIARLIKRVRKANKKG